MKSPLAALADIAETQLGVHEEGGENTGSQIRRYQAATSLGGTGWPWCAAFVCWVFQEAIKRELFKLAVSIDKVPRTAAAFDLDTDWAKSVNALVFGPSKIKPDGLRPMRGDIVVFTFSHVAFVTADYDWSGKVRTVEGNTNELGSREGTIVARKARLLSVCRNFVRPSLAALPESVGQMS